MKGLILLIALILLACSNQRAVADALECLQVTCSDCGEATWVDGVAHYNVEPGSVHQFHYKWVACD